ncbi:glycosyltransferase [Planotetraspora sp. A-T 1434]|uniref:glycosyltransferase n=1 Tax=Planotetraspora sp. A-T 1434 TaxID=2979219 RepID=UPI0021C15EB5|nr:glycosyltransferase [Planotetraspora sp. A-T 1434]MCT9930237.1 glycosyltransferase [Planotetraspora sp. A-T 1434]
MRIAHVCRDLATDRATGTGAQVFATALAQAGQGHEVCLVSEALPSSRLRPPLTWLRLSAPRPDHRYFTEPLEYADRVYDTLREHGPFDVIEFSHTGGEALTVLRARRLLGEFASATIAVTLTPWHSATGAGARSGPGAHRPVTYHSMIAEFAEGYCRARADVVIAESVAVARTSSRPVTLRRPSPPDLPGKGMSEERTVLRLGALHPGSGVEAFLRAAERVAEKDPDLRFTLRGDDTPADPVGHSYWDHLRRMLPSSLRDRVVYGGPVRTEDIGTLPVPGTPCVLPESASEPPGTAALAAALGYPVIAAHGSTAADLLDGVRIVPPGDPDRLAGAILDAVARPSVDPVRHTPDRRAAAAVPVRSRPVAAAPARRAPGCPVTVVIPLHDQGRYVRDAVESVRRSDHPDVEILVVDDGSTDPETIRAFDSLHGVTKVRQANAGLPAARNAGVEKAAGRYIVPLDADDLLPSGFIGSAVRAMERHPDLGYVAGYLRYFGLLEFTHVPVGHVPGLSLVLNTHPRATGMFRRDALLEVGGYDAALPAYEDWDLYIRLHKAGYDSDILPIEGQLYRRHAESMTFSTSNGLRLELLQHLLRKHADLLSPDRSLPLVLTLAHLWKTGYEPSASVLLQREGGLR